MKPIDPNNVTSPKKRWKLHKVIYNNKKQGWSVAEGTWDDGGVLGIRWNGDKNSKIGQPQSRGLPTWFIVPEAIRGILRKEIDRLNKSQKNSV